jgi:hypothetical protein
MVTMEISGTKRNRIMEEQRSGSLVDRGRQYDRIRLSMRDMEGMRILDEIIRTKAIGTEMRKRRVLMVGKLSAKSLQNNPTRCK